MWEDTPNNGITLLVLGWAYVLTANLVERQQLRMKYSSVPSEQSGGPRSQVRLDYALSQERAWWKALVTPGIGYSISGADLSPDDKMVSPWAVQVQDIGIDVSGEVVVGRRPPSAREAAQYIARLCRVFGLGNQCSAALAAALTFPLHASIVGGKSAMVELPRPSLTSYLSRPAQDDPPPEFPHIGYYMSLSLCPGIFGPLLWSVFWEPGVTCNSAGAWLRPIETVLRPIIEKDELELLAKVLSFTSAAPLWLGLALCGPRAIVKSILPSITQLAEYIHTKPDIDSAAWTGIVQSFLHVQSPGPYLQDDGTVSGADVWSLRYDCHHEYEDPTFAHPPSHGWPPFGRMRREDIELEIQTHLRCSHRWEYSYWTWELAASQVTDAGFSTIYTTSPTVRPPQTGIRGTHRPSQDAARAVSRISRQATEMIFWWCCSQVERGFGNTLVPRLAVRDGPLRSAGSDSSFSAEVKELVGEWLQKQMEHPDSNGPGCDLFAKASEESGAVVSPTTKSEG